MFLRSLNSLLRKNAFVKGKTKYVNYLYHNTKYYFNTTTTVTPTAATKRLGSEPHMPTIKYNDIVKIASDESGSFANLPGRTISFDVNEPISMLKLSIKDEYPEIYNIRLYDEYMIEFTDLTPVQLIIRNQFLLNLNEEWYCILPNNTDNALFDINFNYSLQQKPIIDLCQHFGMSIKQMNVIGRMVPKFIEILNQNTSQTIDKTYVDLVLRKIIIEETLSSKNKLERINDQLQFLQNKLVKLEDMKSEVDLKLQTKARKMLKRFFTLMFSQVIMIQYGTYMAFSWDIMEPITCLFGILDIFIAYSFYLWTNKPYSFETIESNYKEKKELRFYKKAQLDTSEIEEVKSLIEYLQVKKMLYSPALENIIDIVNAKKEKANENDDINNQ